MTPAPLPPKVSPVAWYDNTVAYVAAIIVSILMLWKGADWMVDAVARLARRFNISELVIGLTFVAFGTSAPELAVSVGAALEGKTDISVGNVVGSNIFNLGIILGGCAAIRPIMSSRVMVYRDGLFLIAVTLLLATFLNDLSLDRQEGITMLVLLAAYLGFLFWRKAPSEEEAAATEHLEKGTWKDLPVAIGGIAIVLVGAKLLVFGASEIAQNMGLSDWVIAMTIVAFGTSAPEVVTSFTAVIKGHHGISAGGLIGSDIYNLLGVLGAAATIRVLPIAPEAHSSVMVMVAVVAVVILLMRIGWRLTRVEGIILVIASVVRLWLDVTK